MLYSLLEQTAKAHPNTIAIWSPSSQCTYNELNKKVKILSNGLLKIGLKKGDRIASYLHSCPEAVQLYFACFKIGVSIIVMNPFYRQFEIRLLVETAQPKLFITQFELYKNLQKLIEEFSLFKKHYYLVDYTYNDDSNILPFSNLLNENHEVEKEEEEIPGEQEAVILLTSGTTGRSKCIQSNHSQKLWNTKSFESFYLNQHNKILLMTPMNGLTALDFNILPSTRYGSTICYIPSNLPHHIFLKMVPLVLYEQNITCIICISSVLRDLLEEIKDFTKGEFRKNSLRYCFIGGEKSPISLYENTKKWLNIYPVDVYGMTEINGPCAISADYPPKCGRFKPLGETTKFRITNDNWEDLPCNTSGEVTIYSNTIMTGYLNDEITTQKVMKNRWFKSGDYGYLEIDGTLNIVGRIKQIIICNGENINLIEIEETLLEYHDVHQVCATSIPYMDSEKLVAYVTFHSSCSMDTAEIEQNLFLYLKEKLAECSIPLYIRILDSLPTTINGKIDRKMLSERALKEFTQS